MKPLLLGKEPATGPPAAATSNHGSPVGTLPNSAAKVKIAAVADTLALGLDIGGTSSRALVIDSLGRRLGAGQASGGNPTAHDVGEAVAAIATAVQGAVADIAPDRVHSAVIGMAGVGRLQDPDTAARFEAMWRAVGLRCTPQPVSDATVAFAAGTPAPDGTLLLAGTGAIAADIRNRKLRQIADGHGWLLGDLGSGFWLGREAVRAALGYLDGWAPSSDLTRRVLKELLDDDMPRASRETVTAVINAVRAEPPVRLSRFARTILDSASAGDHGARQIAAQAARHLIDTASRVRPDSDPGRAANPLVLSGSLLTVDTPIATDIRAAAAKRWPHAPIRAGADGAAAAAWIAACELPQPALSPEDLHFALLGGST